MRFPTKARSDRCPWLAATLLLGTCCCAESAFAQGVFISFQPSGAISTVPTSINLEGAVTGFYSTGFTPSASAPKSAVHPVGPKTLTIAYGLCLIAFAGACHGFVRSPLGAITTFDVPGSFDTIPFGINLAGTIAGTWFDGNGNSHSFVRDANGKITSFDPPGSTFGSQAYSINPEGAIAGSFSDGNGQHGFVRNPNGTFLKFDVKGASATIPYSINAAYVVTGSADSAGFWGLPSQPFLATFNPPGSNGTVPTSINGADQIAGYYFDATGAQHGFFRNAAGMITSFDPAGSTGTMPWAINSWGAIMGTWLASRFNFHCFVRHVQGTITSFDTPLGSPFCTSINDLGVIAGTYFDQTGGSVGFVRLP